MIEDQLIDNAVRKAAGRVSPGREPVRVLLARSDDVDRLDGLAQGRRWREWLEALEATKPNRDAKRDSYRLHNLAVANEAIAYEATALEEQAARLQLARGSSCRPGSRIPTRSTSPSRRGASTPAAPTTRSLPSSTKGQGDADAHAVEARTASTLRRTAPPASCAAASVSAAAMTNKDVVDLRVAGLDDDNLIAAIKDAQAVNFDLSPAGLKSLLSAKVSNASSPRCGRGRSRRRPPMRGGYRYPVVSAGRPGSATSRM